MAKKTQTVMLGLVKPFDSERFNKAWDALITDNKHWRKKTERQLQLALADLSQYSEDDAIEAIKAAYIGEYRGIFPKHTKPKSNQSFVNAVNGAASKLGL